jgi:hypothetical protein
VEGRSFLSWAEPRHEFEKIFGQRSVEMQALPRTRVLEAEMLGVKRGSAEHCVTSTGASVHRIPDERQAGGGQVYTDLMGSPGFRSNLEFARRRLRVTPQNAPLRNRGSAGP